MTFTPESVLLISLRRNKGFITTLTKRPGRFLGTYSLSGLGVEWEDELPGPKNVHRNFRVIPVEDNH